MSATTEQITLVAPDISCDHCTSAIERALGSEPGVRQVSASVPTKEVQVAYDPNQLSVDRIKSVLAEEGYPAQTKN